jgi:hypothetical protein
MVKKWQKMAQKQEDNFFQQHGSQNSELMQEVPFKFFHSA